MNHRSRAGDFRQNSSARPMERAPKAETANTDDARNAAKSDAAGDETPSEKTFAELGLGAATLAAIEHAGYTVPTPIQQKAIGPALEGRDVLGCARTGTGKTAAFVLPMLERLEVSTERHRRIRSLVLAPTRELAIQIGESITTYGKNASLRHVVVYGGVSQSRQVDALRRGVDVLVACPGRLCDLMSQGEVKLEDVQILVIDEFDRMLDDGFLPDIRRILARVPRDRQTLLFSATVPREVEPVLRDILRDPVRVSVHAQASTPDLVDQHVMHVGQSEKRSALANLLDRNDVTRALVFTRTKHGANRVVKQLGQTGLTAEAIHGNKSQNARQRSLERFKNGSLRVLVATDVAARGLDIDEVSHVVNFDLPVDPESYVHRIGRTARAGKTGMAISFCTPDERSTLVRIERMISRRIPVMSAGEPRSQRSSDDRRPSRDDSDERPRASRASSDDRRDDRRVERRDEPRRSDRNDDRRSEPRRIERSSDRRPETRSSERPYDDRRSESRSSERTDDRRSEPRRSERPYDRASEPRRTERSHDDRADRPREESRYAVDRASESRRPARRGSWGTQSSSNFTRR
jgi:ATP-dependent RNA helicase RhlE